MQSGMVEEMADERGLMLQARWQTDTVALTPDLLSILIGVNDLLHTKTGNYTGTPHEYETGYTALLETTQRALPQAQLVLLEPVMWQYGLVQPA